VGGTALIETGVAEQDVTVLLTWAGTNTPGLVFLANSDADRWGLFLESANGNFSLFKSDGGSSTVVVPSTPSPALSAGQTYVVRAVVAGGIVYGFLNGKQMIQHTLSAADQTKYGGFTKAGIRAGVVAASGSWDNFIVRPAA
jgi:hypothetical protein